MTKLTDTQLIVLASAGKHDDGLATRPPNLNAAAAAKVAWSLVDKGLAREIRAKADAPVWHENDEGRFALKITGAGREAIGVDDAEAQEPAPLSGTPAAPRSKPRGSKPAAKMDAQNSPAARKKANGRRERGRRLEASPTKIRAGSKQARIIDLMSRRRALRSRNWSKRRTGSRIRHALRSRACANAGSRWSGSRRGQGLRLPHQGGSYGSESGLTHASGAIQEAAGQKAGC